MNGPLKINDVLARCSYKTVFDDTFRVLAISEPTNEVWLIDRPGLRKRAGQEKRSQQYVRAPYISSLDLTLDEIRHGRLVKLKLPVANLMSDEDRIAAAMTAKERKSVETEQRIRDSRFKCIKAIVCENNTEVLRNFLDVFRDPDRVQKVKQQAETHGVSIRHIYNTLHQFWAGGSIRNALNGKFNRCGNPGEPKPQHRHLGRKSKRFHAGLTSSDGYALTEDCKRKIAYGYAMIRQGVTVSDAYLMTMGAHWAHHIDDIAMGQASAKLYEPERRPTIEQFEYWGRNTTNKSVTELVLGPIKYRQSSLSRGGSEQDLVVAVGQLSGFDATSTDVYLTRTSNRLKRLPPMTRSILVDVRTQVIYGVYCGWDGASPATALKTILHGADPDKKAWAARFDVDMPDGAMPAMLARQHLADNGELKAEASTEAESQFGFGVMIAPTRQGDRKGGVESQHRSDHAKLDHKLPGTTFGRQRERGEKAPVTLALWNYYEYMRELIYHIIEHNTRVIVPELAPDAMLLEDPPISPTRINIFNWLSDHGMNNSLPVDFEALRALCLPNFDAVIRKDGVYLELELNGRKQIIRRLRFTSAELVATGLLSTVKRTGSHVHTKVRLDPSNPFSAWLPSKAGLIPLQSCSSDKIFQKKVPLTELIAMFEEMDLDTKSLRSDEDQFQLEKLLRRSAVTENAQREVKHAEKASGRRFTNAEAKRELRANKAAEMDYIDKGIKAEVDRESVTADRDESTQKNGAATEVSPQAAAKSMADLIMERRHARLGRTT